MDSKDFQKNFDAAYKFLSEQTTNREKFESIRSLIKGFNPKVDTALERVSKALSDIEKVQKGEVIDLTIEHLPEKTEEEKKRKKKILAFIRLWKDLTSEVERVRNELSQNSKSETNEQAGDFARIIKGAKGMLGIVTIVAVGIVAVFGIINFQKTPAQTESSQTQESSLKQKIQVIDVNGKKIPLSELRTGIGPECTTAGGNAPHYHAKTGQTTQATDGTKVTDPGGCGFGKVEEVKVEEIEQP